MKFWLGTHQPQWLGRVDVPLFVSRRTLVQRKRSLPRALGSWALDSGGFSELSLHGAWTVTAIQYVREVRRWSDEIGQLAWAAIQDWMCEPFMLRRTGLSLEEYQRRTIASYSELLYLAPGLPWVPVLQGWSEADYLRHLDAYAASGFDLRRLPLVGLGSVCRRQGTSEAAAIVSRLAREGLRLHGFGFKQQGLVRCGDFLASSDSLAWSYAARRRPPLPGHDRPGAGRLKGHQNCANCLEYALQWRAGLLRRLPLRLDFMRPAADGGGR